jgi:hypothetical protein
VNNYGYSILYNLGTMIYQITWVAKYYAIINTNTMMIPLSVFQSLEYKSRDKRNNFPVTALDDHSKHYAVSSAH